MMKMRKMIDSHIHLDFYKDEEITDILGEMEQMNCAGLISVSFHLESSKRNMALSKNIPMFTLLSDSIQNSRFLVIGNWLISFPGWRPG